MLRRGFILYFFFGAFFIFSQTGIEKVLNKAELVYDENPAESFSLCESAEREAKEENNHQFDGNISICKARYLILIASFEAATVEVNNAISIFKKNEDELNLVHAYSLKSLLLSKMGDLDAAHKLNLEVLELDRQIGNTSGIIGSLLNLTLGDNKLNQPDSMKLRLDELSELTDEFRTYDFYYYYQNWGIYYLLIDDPERAIQQYETALKVAEKEKMTDAKATCLMLLSRAHRENKNFLKANEYAEKSYRFSQENNLIYETSEALVEWIAAKEERGEFKEAFEIQKKWIRINNEIFDMEKIQKVKNIEGQLKIVEKENEIAEGEIALQKSNLEGQKARTRNAWLIGVVLLIVVLLFYTGFVYFKTKKLNFTIQQQKEIVELKSLKLEEAISNIQDSLEYSKMIQNSMLPSSEQFAKAFKEHFILFKPKDIVSGDFYWFHQTQDTVVFAVGDCTGHGVPGAMVSMVCHEALNKVIIEKGVVNPAEVLDMVREIVSNTFKSNSHDLNDGMDIALCTIKNDKLTFAGAYNPAWVFTKREITETQNNSIKISILEGKNLAEIKADKQPIGKYYNPSPFTNKEFSLETGDVIYICTDGFADQFGGEKGKKLKASNFKSLLAKAQYLSLNDQKEHLNNVFEQWKGPIEQLDDVCVIGVRV